MPEERKTGEPEYSPTHDRLFSELPVADRWRLVKEALNDLRPDYPPSRLRSLRFVVSICGVSAANVLVMLRSKHVPVSGSFRLWLVSHFFAISVLLLAAWWFDQRSEGCAGKMALSLGQIEDDMLKPKVRK